MWWSGSEQVGLEHSYGGRGKRDWDLGFLEKKPVRGATFEMKIFIITNKKFEIKNENRSLSTEC